MFRSIGRAARLLPVIVAVTAAQGAEPVIHGPYNIHLLAGGSPLTKTFGEWKPHRAGSPWAIQGWVQADDIADGVVLLAGFGAAGEAGGHALALDQGHPVLWSAGKASLKSTATLKAGQWVWLAASSDGKTERLWLDGHEIAKGKAGDDGAASPVVVFGQREANIEGFGGRLAGLSVDEDDLTPERAKALASARPDADLTVFEEASPVWAVQVKAIVGMSAPQDPWTLPKSKASFSKPVAKPIVATPGLAASGANRWTLGDFRLQAAPKVSGDGAALSKTGYDAGSWYVATVPGTVLTTLVDRGVYPDPDYGLNNMAIPESLARQNYWYRDEFDVPADLAGKHLLLNFEGINYAAEVWLNGQRLGGIKGAFIRGRFDVTAALQPGKRNALAVLVSPPPHPGIPHEQSILAGAGENGGMQALDGPTFIATEGWDWIPGVRDRNTGLWRNVTLEASGTVRLGDVQVVTSLPLPDLSKADVKITVPVENTADHPVSTTVTASFDGLTVSRQVTLAPGAGEVALDPVSVANPTLWWPNGMGEPILHTAHVTVAADNTASDAKDVRFGIREITYELSLMDPTGHLRRVEVDPTKSPGVPLVDGSHEGIRKIVGGWVQSLTPAGVSSSAVKPLTDKSLTPYLVLRVNGVRVPARGGAWGTDEYRKRVSRERLEPFFRLHKEAHINIIRNWVGQNTEEVFYDLADEYGLLVFNDFWESTQDDNLEAEDTALFLANAADVIKHYRNHPSIALWFGRNEGVPQPVLNQGLAKLVTQLDGTRHYMGSSNRINLQDSGPYDYREPASYFTTHSKGFAVEVGQPSFPTAEAFKAAIAPEDVWPISDAWAYHDWHQDGNGDTRKFMAALDRKLGAASDFDDFERKAQLLTYEAYRAIFEGMNAELWNKTSGRLLWMTQPAWPSTNWQIMSSDYDTHSAFYGMQMASEPVHAQMDLPDFGLTVVNNTLSPLSGLTLKSDIYGLDGRLLASASYPVEVGADTTVKPGKLALKPVLADKKAVVVSLHLTDGAGKVLSENVYWQTDQEADMRRLSAMAPQPVALSARQERRGDEVVVRVDLADQGSAPALMAKLTLLQADGTRLLPAYAKTNYVSLLPGQPRTVEISVPASAVKGAIKVAVRGWNVQPQTVGVTQ
jgi:hypothetical protein